MKPQINYAPAMLVGKVVVSEGASFRTHGAVDTSGGNISFFFFHNHHIPELDMAAPVASHATNHS